MHPFTAKLVTLPSLLFDLCIFSCIQIPSLLGKISLSHFLHAFLSEFDEEWERCQFSVFKAVIADRFLFHLYVSAVISDITQHAKGRQRRGYANTTVFCRLMLVSDLSDTTMKLRMSVK